MNDLVGVPGELRGIVTITRKATGAIETYALTGRVSAGPPDATMAPAVDAESEGKGE